MPGIAALLIDAMPDATPGEIRAALLDGAVDLGAVGRDLVFGEGRIDGLDAEGLVDTDRDGILNGTDDDDDGDRLGIKPLKADSDSDGTPDSHEDTDGDTSWNLAEVLLGTDPGSGLDTPTQSYNDVPLPHPQHPHVELLAQDVYVRGCDAPQTLFCPDQSWSRDTAAIWLARLIAGSGLYMPPVPSVSPFADVVIGSGGTFAAHWIIDLFNQSVTEGCAAGLYCPQQAVDRTQLAILVLKAVNGFGYSPPAAVSAPFTDVDIGASGVAGDGDFGADWVIEAVNQGYIAGCATGRYCPHDVVTQRVAAEALSRAFGLAPAL